jgi:hypothetical protein
LNKIKLKIELDKSLQVITVEKLSLSQNRKSAPKCAKRRQNAQKSDFVAVERNKRCSLDAMAPKDAFVRILAPNDAFWRFRKNQCFFLF